MLIREIALPHRHSLSRRGLSERIARRILAREGYEVFRGVGFLGPSVIGYYHEYENVRKKYDRLESLLFDRLGNALFAIRSVLRTPAGMPDFIGVRKHELLFCEAKLEHETIRKHQLEKMALLDDLGFPVLFLRVKETPYRLGGDLGPDGTLSTTLRQKRFIRRCARTARIVP